MVSLSGIYLCFFNTLDI